VQINDLINQLISRLESAKKQTLGSGFVIGDKEELISLVADIRALLPTVVADAEQIIHQQTELLNSASNKASTIISNAQAERDRLASNHEVLLTAASEAEAMRAEVLAELAQMRAETDKYVDGQLARFEAALTKVLGSVRKGRDRLGPLGPSDDV
jgi:chromosome segregation ATPase